jgi:two-component system nitrate/nitrite response regulator NarL
MPTIELLLGSALIEEGLATLLTAAGLPVLREPNLPDGDTIVIIGFDGSLDLEGIGAHLQRGAKVVLLASETAGLTMSDDEIAPLSGLLTYGLSAEAFVRSLHLIGAGERVFPRELAGKRKPEAPPSAGDARSDGVRLSPREKEVLAHLVDGSPNKMIARHLGMTEATVKVHLKSVLRKIRVENRTQAAIWALANLPELGDTPRGSV